MSIPSAGKFPAGVEVSDSAHPFWPHELLLGLMPLLIGLNLLITTVYLPLGLKGFADFRQIYTGGYMVRTGFSSRLYNYDEQQRLEEQLVPMGGGLHFLLPITHLAYEELLLAPLSALPYRYAFWTFLAMNSAVTLVCWQLLKRGGQNLWQRWKFFVPCLMASFFPIWRTLLQGQDSVILLALLLGAMHLLERGHCVRSGMLVGLGLFKFNIVIPIALLLLLWRQRRFFAGFAASALGALGLSAILMRSSGIHDYIHLVSAMSVNLGSQDNILRYATIAPEMMNLRGLFAAILEGHAPAVWIQVTVFVASIAVISVAARSRPSFPLAISAAALVSYNFVAHDASILIISVVQALNTKLVRPGLAALVALVLPFTAIDPKHGYVGALGILALYISQLEFSPRRFRRTE